MEVKQYAKKVLTSSDLPFPSITLFRSTVSYGDQKQQI